MQKVTMARIAIFFLTIGLAICAAAQAAEPDKAAIAVEALSRLKGLDLEANPSVKAAVMRVIHSTRGTPQFVELVRDFKIKDQDAALLDFAMAHPSDSTAAEAMRLILANQNIAILEKALRGAESAKAVEPLGNTGEKQILPLLEPLITDTTRDTAARHRAVHALAQVQDGAAYLLRLAQQDKLPEDLKLTASSELNAVRWTNINAEAARILPLPQSQNSEPLPPVSELARRKGDALHGELVFFSAKVGCGNCHQIGGKGLDFGPKLSEIGTKLGKDALYVAILDPNAGISFGYETWQLELKNGDEAFGLLASETVDEIAVKAQTGIVSKYKKSEIAKREQQKISIMPAELQQAMSTQDLVDLIEYLSSLKKASQ
jgi:putative heme-binding domain-containing protein